MDKLTLLQEEAKLRRELKRVYLEGSGPPGLTISDYRDHLSIELLEVRSKIDFGEDFVNNPVYKNIRWGRGLGESPIGTPLWRSRFAFNTSRKQNGTWNRRRGLFPGDSKTDTRVEFFIDLRTCIEKNIPFKGKSIRYDNLTQWVYVHDRPVLKHAIEKGCIEGFTYSGVYDKLTSFVLRMFGVYVTRRPNRGNVVWESKSMGEVEIDFDKYYEFPLLEYAYNKIRLFASMAHIVINPGIFMLYKKHNFSEEYLERIRKEAHEIYELELRLRQESRSRWANLWENNLL